MPSHNSGHPSAGYALKIVQGSQSEFTKLQLNFSFMFERHEGAVTWLYHLDAFSSQKLCKRIKRTFTWWWTPEIMHRMDIHATLKPLKYLSTWSYKVNHFSFYLLLDKELLALFKMLGVRLKSKPKKRSRGFIGGTSGSVSDVDRRVVMFCEDIPSVGSSWDSGRDSGRDSHSSGAHSSNDELGHAWRSHSFHGREGQSMSSSSRPTKQYSVREIRHVEPSPIYGQNAGPSTLCIRDQYESALLLLCAHIVFSYKAL